MLSIAEQLGFIAPQPMGQWDALINGAEVPTLKTIEELPDVPRSVYGLHLQTGYWRERRAQKEARRRVIIAMLQEHGGMTTETIAKLFGMTVEATYQDLRRMHADGRIGRSRKAPYVWREA